MRSHEEFGKYLLLKKLTEDPLGETFRGGRVGEDGVEQVVLLRVFNGSAVEADRLAGSIAERSDIQAKLKNPNIGNGVDLGEERGVPFVAYDYISGRNLETLLIQASNTNSPIPADHAVLIAERMSLALSVAAESRFGNQRLVHGFAVPHLVMISNEGETRVLGFEAAAGLAEQAGRFDRQITRYLAPEVVAGEAVERSDDVFTLGAVLFELLACQPLPSPAADGTYLDAIAGAQVAYDGEPIPAPLADLLRQSLAPRGRRLASAGDWHKALSGLMADAGYGATTFNLAFFMHNLFRNEIEQENEEIEEEKTLTLTAADLGLDSDASGEPQESPAAGVESPATIDTVEEKKGINKALLGAVAALLLVALAAGAWFFLGGGGGDAEEPQTTQAPDPQLPAEPEPEPEPQGPTPEEIQAQLAEMIDARSTEMENKLREQYDARIRDMQRKLEEAQTAAERAAAEQEKERLEAEREAAAEAARQQAEQEAAEEAARLAESQEQGGQQQGSTGGDGQGGDGQAGDGQGGDATARVAETDPAPPPQPAEPEPTVREGDLVTPGPGVKPPELVVQPDVRYPAMAKKLSKEAEVEVRVLVDERGNVRTAERLGKKAGFGFDQAALEAARSARFRPAQKEGVRVKMYFNLTIKFSL